MRRMILQGKIWEIRHLLKVYAEKYTYVHEWIHDMNRAKRKSAKIYPFPKKRLK